MFAFMFDVTAKPRFCTPERQKSEYHSPGKRREEQQDIWNFLDRVSGFGKIPSERIVES